MSAEFFMPPDTSLEGGEFEEKKEILYKNDDVQISHPVRQAIPKAEGLHLVVEPINGNNVGEELKAEFFALGIAKVVAESRYTPEFWANIHKNAYPGTEKGINVFGRHPQSESAWGKPVDIKIPGKRVEEPLDDDQREKLEEVMRLYLPRWEKAGERITLFEGGIKSLDPTSEKFQEQREKSKDRPWPWANYTAWMTDKYELTVVLTPHIKGVHLVLSPLHEYWSKLDRQDFKNPEKSPIKSWETPKKPEGSLEYAKGVLESFAILEGVKKILEEKMSVFNGEIHFSGNWGFVPVGAPSEKKGRRVDEEYLVAGNPEDLLKERINTKRQLLKDSWMSQDGGWASHGHYYATDSPDSYVSLPSRSKTEKPEEWEDIPEMTEEQAEQISQIIQANLTNWLIENNLENRKLLE